MNKEDRNLFDEIITDNDGDMNAIAMASDCWTGGDHAEALRLLEIGLGRRFCGLRDLLGKQQEAGSSKGTTGKQQ